MDVPTEFVVGLCVSGVVLFIPLRLLGAALEDRALRSAERRHGVEGTALSRDEVRAIRIGVWTSVVGLTVVGVAVVALLLPASMWYQVAWRQMLDAHTFKAYHQGRRPVGGMCAIGLSLAALSILFGVVGWVRGTTPRLGGVVAALGLGAAAAGTYLLVWWSHLDMSKVPSNMP